MRMKASARLRGVVVSIALLIAFSGALAAEPGVTYVKVRIPKADILFFQMYLGKLYSSRYPHISSVVAEVQPDVMENANYGKVMSEIRSLSFPEKFRFVLLCFMAFSHDGENGETFGDNYLGKDKLKVAEALGKITDEEWHFFCISFGLKGDAERQKIEELKGQARMWKAYPAPAPPTR